MALPAPQEDYFSQVHRGQAMSSIDDEELERPGGLNENNQSSADGFSGAGALPSGEDPTAQLGSDRSKFNNAFFHWQSDGGFRKVFSKYKAFKKLEYLQAVAADTFMDALGSTPMFRGTTRRTMPDVQSWATVHSDCVFHGPHNHGEILLSGVYYVRVPPGAGDLQLHDPRGPHGPFQTRLSLQPRAGDFVLFPSYLVHQVQPSQSSADDPRISVAMNVGVGASRMDEQETVPKEFIGWPVRMPTAIEKKGAVGRGVRSLEEMKALLRDGGIPDAI